MRHGTTRRRTTNTQYMTWMPPGIQVVQWGRHSRRAILRELAAGAVDLTWSRRLVHVLLDELQISDEFDRHAEGGQRIGWQR
jgi:hypothetical protein